MHQNATFQLRACRRTFGRNLIDQGGGTEAKRMADIFVLQDFRHHHLGCSFRTFHLFPGNGLCSSMLDVTSLEKAWKVFPHGFLLLRTRTRAASAKPTTRARIRMMIVISVPPEGAAATVALTMLLWAPEPMALTAATW